MSYGYLKNNEKVKRISFLSSHIINISAHIFGNKTDILLRKVFNKLLGESIAYYSSIITSDVIFLEYAKKSIRRKSENGLKSLHRTWQKKKKSNLTMHTDIF